MRQLLGHVPASERKRRASKRTERRFLLKLQRAATWVATHGLDERPPTEIHKTLQDVRRADERRFMKELLPQIGLEPGDGAA